MKISTWFVSYYNEMHAYASRKTDSNVAKDIMQETFLGAIEGLASFHQKSAPKTWLYAILNRKIADHFRRIKINAESRDSFETADTVEGTRDQLLDDPEFIHFYKRTLASLPRQWRKILTDKYIHNKSGAEICEKYNISKENYWQIIRRTRILLKDKISNFAFS